MPWTHIFISGSDFWKREYSKHPLGCWTWAATEEAYRTWRRERENGREKGEKRIEGQTVGGWVCNKRETQGGGRGGGGWVRHWYCIACLLQETEIRVHKEREKTESEMYPDQRLMYSRWWRQEDRRRDGQHSFYPSLSSLTHMLCVNKSFIILMHCKKKKKFLISTFVLFSRKKIANKNILWKNILKTR